MTRGISRRHVYMPPLDDAMRQWACCLGSCKLVIMLWLKCRDDRITLTSDVFFARVTVTLSRWPSYKNLTRIIWSVPRHTESTTPLRGWSITHRAYHMQSDLTTWHLYNELTVAHSKFTIYSSTCVQTKIKYTHQTRPFFKNVWVVGKVTQRAGARDTKGQLRAVGQRLKGFAPRGF